MTAPKIIASIITEVMAGGRVMPPLEERIKQRDAMLAARKAAAPIQPATLDRQHTGQDIDGPADYYDDKRKSGNNFTGD